MPFDGAVDMGHAHWGRRHLLFLAMIATSLLAACEEPRVREVKGRLAGTWVLEAREQGGKTRKALVLRPDGSLEETVRTVAANGASASQSREGEWFFDGVNLKRKYTFVDGKPLTNAHFIYETHEVKSVTATELVAGSNVGRGELRFQRSEGAGKPIELQR